MVDHLRLGDASAAPRLALGWSAWALLNLPGDLMGYLPRVVDAGFETIEVSCLEMFLDWNRSLRADFGLALIASMQAVSEEEAKRLIDNAAAMDVVAVNAHLGHGFMGAAEAIDLVGAVQAMADAAGLVLTVETHRGRCTQDALRTTEILAARPDVAVNLDVSHWWVAGEGPGNDPDAFDRVLTPVLERVVMVHGRVSDGQVVQADIGSEGDAEVVAPFLDLWARAIGAWRARAEPGDVFLFEPELGPPPYALVGPDGDEVTDRWQRSLAMAELGRRAWARSMS